MFDRSSICGWVVEVKAHMVSLIRLSSRRSRAQCKSHSRSGPAALLDSRALLSFAKLQLGALRAQDNGGRAPLIEDQVDGNASVRTDSVPINARLLEQIASGHLLSEVLEHLSAKLSF